MGDKLTRRQAEILRSIRKFIRRNGYPPTVRELGERFGFDPSTIFEHLRALQRKGHIKRDPHKSRSLTLLGFPTEEKSEIFELPVVGRVAAGRPILAVENIDETIAIDRKLIRGKESFFLKVKGDSMVDAGIEEGDYVMVASQPTAEEGDIVVALISDEAVVKIFHRGKDHIRLESANPNYEDIVVSRDFSIIGKVTALLRRY